MNTFTVWGSVADKVGAAVKSYGRWMPPARREYLDVPSTRYRRTQARAAVRLAHWGEEIGQVEHLELRDDKQLLAVAVVKVDDDIDLTDNPWFWSPTIRDDGPDTAIDMLECSLTRSPATIGLRPVTILAGDVTGRYGLRDVLKQAPNPSTRDLLQRAHDAAERGGPIEVRTDTHTAPIERNSYAPSYPSYRRRPDEIIIRHGGRVLSVE